MTIATTNNERTIIIIPLFFVKEGAVLFGTDRGGVRRSCEFLRIFVTSSRCFVFGFVEKFFIRSPFEFLRRDVISERLFG